jgi:hypothetical protein
MNRIAKKDRITTPIPIMLSLDGTAILHRDSVTIYLKIILLSLRMTALRRCAKTVSLRYEGGILRSNTRRTRFAGRAGARHSEGLGRRGKTGLIRLRFKSRLRYNQRRAGGKTPSA